MNSENIVIQDDIVCKNPLSSVLLKLIEKSVSIGRTVILCTKSLSVCNERFAEFAGHNPRIEHVVISSSKQEYVFPDATPAILYIPIQLLVKFIDQSNIRDVFHIKNKIDIFMVDQMRRIDESLFGSFNILRVFVESKENYRCILFNESKQRNDTKPFDDTYYVYQNHIAFKRKDEVNIINYVDPLKIRGNENSPVADIMCEEVEFSEDEEDSDNELVMVEDSQKEVDKETGCEQEKCESKTDCDAVQEKNVKDDEVVLNLSPSRSKRNSPVDDTSSPPPLNLPIPIKSNKRSAPPLINLETQSRSLSSSHVGKKQKLCSESVLKRSTTFNDYVDTFVSLITKKLKKIRDFDMCPSLFEMLFSEELKQDLLPHIKGSKEALILIDTIMKLGKKFPTIQNMEFRLSEMIADSWKKNIENTQK